MRVCRSIRRRLQQAASAWSLAKQLQCSLGAQRTPQQQQQQQQMCVSFVS